MKKSKIIKYQNSGKIKLPILPTHINVQPTQDNIRMQYIPIDPIQRDAAEEEARKLRIAQREKELQKHYSQPGMISGMKRKPTPSEVKAHAESSVAYNDKLKNDPVGTLGPDIALSFIPELLMFKGPQQVISKGLNKINPFKSYNPWRKEALDQSALVTELRKELAKNGIIKSQKTLNTPQKQFIRRGVDPWGYDWEEKIDDMVSLIVPKKNPNYIGQKALESRYNAYLQKTDDITPLTKEEYSSIFDPSTMFKTHGQYVKYKFNNRFKTNPSFMTDRNRYATWDMYLGEPQTNHPMYDVSRLTKSKDDVIYTIKPEYMNKESIQSSLESHIDDIEFMRNNNLNTYSAYGSEGSITRQGDSYIIPSDDVNYFGTMGGFHWKGTKLPDGNYEMIANDVWDLHPFSLKKYNHLPKFIRNMEVGKTLGIGKPLNVKVGFTVDGKTKQIIDTFGLSGLGLGALDKFSKTE